MSWKEGIFSLCSVGPSHSLSVSSESRKPLRAFACSCHVTPLAKENVNCRSCSETPQWPLQRYGLDNRTLPTISTPNPLSLYRKRLPEKLSLCCGLKHDRLDFFRHYKRAVVKCLVFFFLLLGFKKAFVMI